MPPWIAGQLEALIAQRGHAWLLHGPAGLGQYELALGLARAWLCDRPTATGACGECPSCHAVDVRTHADLAVLMPETAMQALGWPLSEKAQQELDEKKRKPGREIRVEAMRETVEFAQRTSARGRGKAVLVYPAERMNHVTANALLKTLEEPAGDVRFVLGCEAAHLLLPTIRSRCLSHAMQWPDAVQAQAWLATHGIAPSEAAVLLQATGGRPLEAVRWVQAGRTASLWRRLPRAVAAGDAAVLAEFSPADAIDALQKLCHDQMARQAGAAPRFFDAADLPAPAAAEQLAAWWRELARAARSAEHPFNAGLMTEALVSRARSALHSGQAVPP